MLFAGIVFSAVAMFLGIVTKLPQGGGGLAHNIMVLSIFLPAPPLLPTPLPRKIFYDIEAAIAENELYYIRNPVVTRNGTQGPNTRPLPMPRSAAGSSNATAQNVKFKIPAFPFLAFSLPLQVTQFCITIGEAIGTFAMVFIALCLPWLIIKHIHLVAKTGPARESIAIGTGGLVAQIEPRSGLFDDLRLVIAELDQASAQLKNTKAQAREAGRKAAELDSAKEEALKGLRVERNNALAELAEEKVKLKRLEEEKKTEEDGLKEETTSQLKAWEEKEQSWDKRTAEERKRNKEEIDSLGMGRERESENWSKQVEGLELEKKETKEAFRAKSKNILERMKKEREGWEKEREMLKKEKEGEKAEKAKMVKEKKELEEKRVEEEKVWEKANERMQKRIAELEEDKKKLEEEATEWQREGGVAEEKQNREQKSCEEEAEAKAKKIIAKLEDEVLNGRKLIEELQSDKRRDRQLLLELRAQLVRPTHATSRSHINPLRYGGSTPRAMREPTITGPAFDSTTLPEIPRVKLPPSTPSATTPLLSRPTVRLPPPPSSQLNIPSGGPRSPPPNAPKGPKGFRGPK